MQRILLMIGKSGLAPLREREYRLLFAGQSLSLLGDSLVPLSLAFAVIQLTGSARDLGLVLAAQTAPLVALVLVGGVWADRLPRQKIMLLADLVRAGSQGTIAGLLISGVAEVWHLAALSAVHGAASAFFVPASAGLIPQTVSRANLQQANALLSFSRSSSRIVGPIIAGALVTTVGGGWAFAADAATFVVSGVCLFLLRPFTRSAKKSGSFLSELLTGLQEISRRTWIVVSIAYFSFFYLMVLAPFFVLGPILASERLGGAAAWGVILAASGGGNVVGSLLGVRVLPRRPLAVGFASALPYAAVLVAFATEAPVAIIAGAAFVARAGITFFGALWDTTLQGHVGLDVLSRVSSFDWLVSNLFFPIGLALAGPVAEKFGITQTFWSLAVLFAGSTLAVLAVPSIRSIESPRPTVPSVVLVER